MLGMFSIWKKRWQRDHEIRRHDRSLAGLSPHLRRDIGSETSDLFIAGRTRFFR